MYYKRHIERIIENSRQNYPAVLITGPRQVGKSTVLKNLYQDFNYQTLDDPIMLQTIKTNPVEYLKFQKTPFVIDEIQRVPELFFEFEIYDRHNGQKRNVFAHRFSKI